MARGGGGKADTSAIEWFFTPLSTLFQSNTGDKKKKYIHVFPWVSSVLGWASDVSCPRTRPRKPKGFSAAQTRGFQVTSHALYH